LREGTTLDIATVAGLEIGLGGHHTISIRAIAVNGSRAAEESALAGVL
jgi:hypothetical protein